MTCQAKHSDYNHKETVANLTDEQYKENLQWAAKSYRQAMKGLLVTCRGCGYNVELKLMYRCWFCGSYFCSGCAEGHFGSRK